MTEKISELRVVRLARDGRRRYEESAKRALIERALRPGVSVARLAQEHGINANLLRKWITKYLMEREKGVSPTPQDNGGLPPSGNATDSLAIDPPSSHQLIVGAARSPAFVPVVSVPPASLPPSPSMTLTLHVHLSNGVELELGKAIATFELATGTILQTNNIQLK